MRALIIAVILLAILPLACSDRSSPQPMIPPTPSPKEMAGRAQEDPETVDSPELEAVMAIMREELGEGFEVIGRFPFAVGGDLSVKGLQRLMDHTIFSSYEAFYVQFFRIHPDEVIKVYLFGGEVSYMENAWRLWRDKPSTPYGYYMSSRRSLIMNINTGGGTLIHEMVHALMAYDFPDAPTWFDEGMGSLFEGCDIKYKRILGVENWRLPILKKGIAEKRILPLRELMATTRDEFLDSESSLHYAQARYFCMYMQQEGHLDRFYRNYRDNFEKDPTGVTFAEELFEKKLEEVEADCLKWVKTLRYRGR